jgi:hypothetical protein
MDDNSDVDLDPQADDDSDVEIIPFASTASPKSSARPVTMRLVAVLLTQVPQRKRKKRRAAARPSLGCHAFRSPIAETITRVSLATVPPNVERWITIVSDGLEVSEFANFECAKLPRASTFVQSLQRKRVLGAASLTGIHVRMCYSTSRQGDVGL